MRIPVPAQRCYPRRVKLILAALLFAAPAYAGEIVGRASVTDGDSLAIQGTPIRLHGIDAPESWQICRDASEVKYRCGQVAAKALDAFLSASRPTRCSEMSRDRYRRSVARCWRADGLDVGAWLVRNGYALDWKRYSSGLYAGEQREARRERRGLWSGTFTRPWTERARRR